MLTIYIPTLQEKVISFFKKNKIKIKYFQNLNKSKFKKTRCVNQIEDVCKNIEKTIKQTIQNTLNSLEKDSDVIVNTINSKLKKDSETRSYNLSRSLKSSFFTLISFIIVCCIIVSKIPRATLNNYLGRDVAEQLNKNLVNFMSRITHFLKVVIY